MSSHTGISNCDNGVATESFLERRAHTPMSCYITTSRPTTPLGLSIRRDYRPSNQSQRAQQQPPPSQQPQQQSRYYTPVRGKISNVSGPVFSSPIRRVSTPIVLSTHNMNPSDVQPLSRVNSSKYSSGGYNTSTPPPTRGSTNGSAQSSIIYDSHQLPTWDTTNGVTGEMSLHKVPSSLRVTRDNQSKDISPNPDYTVHSPHRHFTPKGISGTPSRNNKSICLNNSCAFDCDSSLNDSSAGLKIYSTPSSPLSSRDPREGYLSDGRSTPKSSSFFVQTEEMSRINGSPGYLRSAAVFGPRGDMTPHRFRPRSTSGGAIKYINESSTGAQIISFSSLNPGNSSSFIRGGNRRSPIPTSSSSVIERYNSSSPTVHSIISGVPGSITSVPSSVIRRNDSMNTTSTTTYTNNNKSKAMINSTARDNNTLLQSCTTTTVAGGQCTRNHTSSSPSPTVQGSITLTNSICSSNGISQHSSSSHSDHKQENSGSQSTPKSTPSRVINGTQQDHDSNSTSINVWSSFSKKDNISSVQKHFQLMSAQNAPPQQQQQRDDNTIATQPLHNKYLHGNLSSQPTHPLHFHATNYDKNELVTNTGSGVSDAEGVIGSMKNSLNFDNSKEADTKKNQEMDSSRSVVVRRVEEGNVVSSPNKGNFQDEDLLSQTYSSHQYIQLQQQSHEKNRIRNASVRDGDNSNNKYQHQFTKPSAIGRATLRQLVYRYDNRHTENPNSYKEGGYMSVKPGTILIHRYVVIHKLGWGEFSTVWLAYDKRAEEQRHTFVAVKISKCHRSVVESSVYEVSLLKYMTQKLRKGTPVTLLIDSFEHKGDYGTHLCMVMPVCGSNLLSIIDQMKAKRGQKRRDKEIIMLKDIIIGILRGIVELEDVNVIHTDLKPENILVAAPDPKVSQIIHSFLKRNAELVKHVDAAAATDEGDPYHLISIADFGLSVVLEPTNTNNVAARAVGIKRGFSVKVPGIVSNATNGTLIQTREYRAPEILLGCDFNCRSDIWSVGCIVYELISGDFLMDPKRKTRNEREMDVEHLAMMMQIIGPVPPRICNASMRQHNPAPCVSSRRPPRYIHRYFDDNGKFLYSDKYYHYQRRNIAGELESFLEEEEARLAAQFVMACLTYDPMDRPSASELLRHEWLKIA